MKGQELIDNYSKEELAKMLWHKTIDYNTASKVIQQLKEQRHRKNMLIEGLKKKLKELTTKFNNVAFCHKCKAPIGLGECYLCMK